MMLAYDRLGGHSRCRCDLSLVTKVDPLLRQVADEMGLPDEWLNNNVRQFLAPKEDLRELPLDLPGLRVVTPTAGYLLAMKALAGRNPLPGYEDDAADLQFLIRKMGIRSLEEVQTHIIHYYPDDAPDESARAMIAQIIKEEKST